MTTTLTPTTTAAPNGAVPVSTNNAIAANIARLRSEGFGVTPATEAAEVAPETEAVATPDVTDETLVDALPGATQDANGKWRNPDGKFAHAPGTETPAVAEIATDGSESDPETPAPIVVQLRGRNETDPALEIEVTDPDIAERLRQNANDGMRRADYNRQMADVQRERAELREFGTILETAPESIIDQMTPERRSRVFRYMLAHDFETHREVIEQWYQDPTSRREAAVDMREQAGQYRAETQHRSAAERRADEVRAAVATLIPETAAEDDARDFTTDAIAYLAGIARQNGDLDPNKVPDLLTTRVRRYWGNAPSAAPAAPPAALAVARPVGPNAEALAQRARAQVTRVQAAQATRAIAAKVAPQGAGAVATVVDNKPPKGLGVKAAIEWARANKSKVFG